MSFYSWTEIVKTNTNQELERIIHDKTEPTLKISAAKSELKSRALKTTDNLQMLESIKSQESKMDENYSTLYSDKVIYTFAILFSVIFGGILFARNLKETGNKKGIYPVLIFSVLYTALTVYLLNLIHSGIAGTYVFGVIGAIILNKYFWNKYLGEDIIYHRKSFRKPLIIALIIFIPFIVIIILGLLFRGR